MTATVNAAMRKAEIRLNKHFQRMESKGTVPISEACETQSLKSDKDAARKGNDRPVSLTNIEVKIPNKICKTITASVF